MYDGDQMSMIRILLFVVFAMPLIVGYTFAQDPSAPKASESIDCLVLLKAPDEQFAKTVAGEGMTVLAHSTSNTNWLFRVVGKDCAALRAVDGVTVIDSPAAVIVSLEEGVSAPEKQIEELGGIVTRKFENIPGAAVVLPELKLSELGKLPGVVKVRKDHGVFATN